jgi:hypothetical protein
MNIALKRSIVCEKSLFGEQIEPRELRSDAVRRPSRYTLRMQVLVAAPEQPSDATAARS